MPKPEETWDYRCWSSLQSTISVLHDLLRRAMRWSIRGAWRKTRRGLAAEGFCNHHGGALRGARRVSHGAPVGRRCSSHRSADAKTSGSCRLRRSRRRRIHGCSGELDERRGNRARMLT